MTVLLRIDSSSRHEGSASRLIGDDIVRRLAPSQIITRDLAAEPLPYITAPAIAAFYAPEEAWSEEQRTAQQLSADLLDELTAADTLLLTVPIYNFGVPAALKAWIDQVMRIGRTFGFDGQTFTGLVHNKRAIVVVAYGAEGYVDGAMASADFAAPYLRFVLGFIGITDVTVIAAEGRATGASPEAEQRLQAAIAAVGAAPAIL